MELSEASFSFAFEGESFSIPCRDETLTGCKWVALDLPPEFIVVYVHDIGCFGSIDHDVFDVLTSHGAIVYACDHLGHGRSKGKILYLSISDIVDETLKVIDLAKSENNNLPLFLFGINAGALSIISLMLREKEKLKKSVNGIILESPWICSWQKVQPGLYTTVFLMLLNSIAPSLIYDPGVSYLSDTPLYFEATCNRCSLYMPYMTPHFYLSAMDEITKCRQNLQDLPSIPTLFAFGEKDSFLNPKQLEVFKSQIANISKMTVNNYDGGHWITKGNARPQFLQDFLVFVQKHRK